MAWGTSRVKEHYLPPVFALNGNACLWLHIMSRDVGQKSGCPHRGYVIMEKANKFGIAIVAMVRRFTVSFAAFMYLKLE